MKTSVLFHFVVLFCCYKSWAQGPLAGSISMSYGFPMMSYNQCQFPWITSWPSACQMTQGFLPNVLSRSTIPYPSDSKMKPKGPFYGKSSFSILSEDGETMMVVDVDKWGYPIDSDGDHLEMDDDFSYQSMLKLSGKNIRIIDVDHASAQEMDRRFKEVQTNLSSLDLNTLCTEGFETSDLASDQPNLPKEAYAGETRKRTYIYQNGKTTIKEKGSLAWRNNNPGNLRTPNWERYRPYGALGVDKNNFIIFKSAAHGLEALRYLLKNDYKHLSIEKAIYRYAPPTENNTQNYVQTVLRAIKQLSGGQSVTKDTKLSDLPDKAYEILIFAIRKHEGWIKGKVYEFN